MVNSVSRLSRDHTKTPAEVIKMENFHHLFALLSRCSAVRVDLCLMLPEEKPKYN
jgi:hypothetical protein